MDQFSYILTNRKEANMEDKLKKLFDYQKFIGNPHLNEVIKNTINTSLETSTELSDDTLFSVAGGTNIQDKPVSKEDQDIVRKRA